MKLKLTIDTDKVSKTNLEKLLDILYSIEDNLEYNGKTSVSKNIDKLQDLLFKGDNE